MNEINGRVPGKLKLLKKLPPLQRPPIGQVNSGTEEKPQIKHLPHNSNIDFSKAKNLFESSQNLTQKELNEL